MRRTSENLERLTDIREELERQLSRLERQSKSAEKYSEFKAEERELKAQLHSLRYRNLTNQLDSQETQTRELEVKLESFVTERVNIDTNIEKSRMEHTACGDQFNEVQSRFYALGTDIARIEQSIQYSQERNRQLQAELEQNDRETKEAQANLLSDRDRASSLELELAELEPELELLTSTEEDSTGALMDAEQAMSDWQQRWDQFNQRASEPRQKAEVEQSRIQHLEHVQNRLHERIGRLEQERFTLDSESVSEELGELTEQLAELDMQAQSKRERIEAVGESISELRETIASHDVELNEARSRTQTLKGRISSLEALQQAAMGSGKSVTQWLNNHELSSAERLADRLKVDSHWQRAVETALGSALQAITLDDIQSVEPALEQLDKGQITIVDRCSVQVEKTQSLPALVDFVEPGSPALPMLAGIYAVESLSDAWPLRSSLNAGESIMTADGVWIGPNWLRVSKEEDASAGLLARRDELDALSTELESCQVKVDELAYAINEQKQQQHQLEQEREQARREMDESNKRYSELRSQVSARRARIEQQAVRLEQTEKELDDAREQMSQEAENLSQARLILEEAIGLMEKDTEEREQLLNERDGIRGRLDQLRNQARHDKDRHHALAMQHQSVKTQLDSLKESTARLREQVERLQAKREQLEAHLGDARDPAEEQGLELEALLEKRLGVEAELANARDALESIDRKLREYEQGRGKVEQDIQAVRMQLEQSRLSAQTLQVQKQNIEQQMQEQEYNLEQWLANLSDEVSESELEQALREVAQKIERLGPINLAAIEEYKLESERKNYLDAQHADLIEALQTLENAIENIDKETRTRFRETFEQVNSGLQELFPKVFGGGQAYLALTGDDMLDTGITIMARPPGKRNSTIHLLSGGEKALTAIALVFSIFRLNPAPFCMLDEVDAPLDDANVGRYARMVKDMSSQVQFIYITHNKIAMEMAQQLMGVTMHEPGVSRMVTVDVNEAAELAAV